MVSLFVLALAYCPVYAQSRWQPDKTGGWSIKNQVDAYGGRVDKVAYTKNLTAVAEWFHRNHPMLMPPKGFDAVWYFHDEAFGKYERAGDYCTEGEMELQFELFGIENGKEWTWKDEPPNWRIEINSIRSGHGKNFGGLDGYKAQVDDPKLEQVFDKAEAKLFEFFTVFEFEREIAPGVRLYKNGNLVVFNPAKPAYWISVTVKDVMDAYLNYWKIRPIWKEVYDHFLKAYSNFTPQELNSPAYFGGADEIVNVTAQKIGLPIMRFNPEYWDRSKPKSTIQFMSMEYKILTKAEMNERFRNNEGSPDYPGLFNQNLRIEKLAELLN